MKLIIGEAFRTIETLQDGDKGYIRNIVFISGPHEQWNYHFKDKLVTVIWNPDKWDKPCWTFTWKDQDTSFYVYRIKELEFELCD